MKPWPEDFKLEIAINGEIYDTWDRDKIMPHTGEVAYNQAFYPFVTDESINGSNIELGLRLSSELEPKGAALSITHIYYS